MPVLGSLSWTTGEYSTFTPHFHTILWPLILTMHKHINYHTAKHAFPLPIGWWTTASCYLGSVFISASTQMRYSSTPTPTGSKRNFELDSKMFEVWSRKKSWIGFPAMAVSVAAAALNEPTEASATCTSLNSRQALHKLAIRTSSGISIYKSGFHAWSFELILVLVLKLL